MRFSRAKEKRKWHMRRRIIIFATFFYVMLVILCLFAVDYSFNEIATGIPSQNLFCFYKDGNKLNITILGSKFKIEMKSIAEKLNSIYN